MDGRIPWKNCTEHVRQIGVVFGQRSRLGWNVPVMDSFERLKDIYNIPSEQYQNNLEELTQFLHLQELLKMSVRQMSLGQRTRVVARKFRGYADVSGRTWRDGEESSGQSDESLERSVASLYVKLDRQRYVPCPQDGTSCTLPVSGKISVQTDSYPGISGYSSCQR